LFEHLIKIFFLMFANQIFPMIIDYLFGGLFRFW